LHIVKNQRREMWDGVYEDIEDINELPWFTRSLDPDLKTELDRLHIKKGRFLDLGTGIGIQAHGLARLGFKVIGSDISSVAIYKANRLFPGIKFVVDDILNMKLKKNTFDCIFDRGCFHSLPKKYWDIYKKNVKSLLKNKGILFLKCFSKEEIRVKGPNRFSPEEIRQIFQRGFKIEKIKNAHFQGSLKTQPKALFIVMKKI
jgi:SAM-dependent methyltransferase